MTDKTYMYNESLKDALLVGGADAVRQALMGYQLSGEAAAVVAGSSFIADLLGLRDLVEKFLKTVIDDDQNKYIREWLSQTLAVGTGLYIAGQLRYRVAGASKKSDLFRYFMIASADSALATIIRSFTLPLLTDVADM